MEDLVSCAQSMGILTAVVVFLLSSLLGILVTYLHKSWWPSLVGFFTGIAAIPVLLAIVPNAMIAFVVGTFGMGALLCKPFW